MYSTSATTEQLPTFLTFSAQYVRGETSETSEGRVVEGRVVEGRVVEGRVVEGRVVEGGGTTASSTAAISRSLSDCHRWPMSWAPMGMPSRSSPQGTEMAGHG